MGLGVQEVQGVQDVQEDPGIRVAELVGVCSFNNLRIFKFPIALI
jgi:hypothetical protein